MSWEDHTNELLESKKLIGACILSREDGTIYAQSGNITISEGEAENIASYLKAEEKPASLLVSGTKYMSANYQDDIEVAYLVKKNGGVCAGMAKTLIVVGVWSKELDKNIIAGHCNAVIEKKLEEFIKDDF